ncbi:MAG TPA: pyridoxamine 5'-phosphate oxidase family protein [Streptosporangiaceae bacterium]
MTVRGAARALLPARKRHIEERRTPWSQHESESGHLPGSEGEHILQEQLGTSQRAKQFYDKQVVDYLTPVMTEFIGRMEMAFVATSDPAGECDCSFRAGAPGFVRVIDDKTIAYPELRGNGVMASMGNMLQNPHIGVFFVDFSRDLIGLHVNGDASIVPPAHMLEFNIEIDEAENAGKKPVQWVLIHVTEAYIHCSKHIPLLVPQSRVRHWGTDNPRHKGGDYFGVTSIKAEAGLIEPRRRAAAVVANGVASHSADPPAVPVAKANGSALVPAVNGSALVPAVNGSAPHPPVNGSAPVRAANGAAWHLVVNVSDLAPVASGSARVRAVNGSAPAPAVNDSAFLSAPTPAESAPMPHANGAASHARVNGSARPHAGEDSGPLPTAEGPATLVHARRSVLRPQCNGSASLPRANGSLAPPTANGARLPD